jgi:hypothetical protein
MSRHTYDEITHFAAENFCFLVDTPSTREKRTMRLDDFGRTIETIVFYRGSRILGKQVRDVCGWRYYLRKERAAR